MVREIRSLFQVSISPFAWTTGNWPWVDGSVSCRWRNIDEWIVYIMGGVAPGSDRTVMSALSTNSHTCIVLFPFSCSLFSFHRSHTNVSDPENVQFLVRPGLLFVLLNIKTSHHYQPHPSSPHAHCLGQPVLSLNCSSYRLESGPRWQLSIGLPLIGSALCVVS